MVELVDTLDLGSSFKKVWVQVPFLVSIFGKIVQGLERWNHNPNDRGSNPFFAIGSAQLFLLY